MTDKERTEKTKTETDDEGNTTTETEVKEEDDWTHPYFLLRLKVLWSLVSSGPIFSFHISLSQAYCPQY